MDQESRKMGKTAIFSFTRSLFAHLAHNCSHTSNDTDTRNTITWAREGNRDKAKSHFQHKPVVKLKIGVTEESNLD